MLEFPRWKVWLIGIVIAVGVLLSIPSLIAGTPYASAWPKWLPQYKINLGLDLAGGSHLLLEADAQDALKQRLQAKEDEVATELRRDPRIDIGDISTAKILLKSYTLYRGTLNDLPEVKSTLAQKVEVSSADPSTEILLETDGELPGKLPAVYEVVKDALRVRVPRSAY